jgi:two-component system cell cycle sensor histidine kinase/response regulator CckA
MSTSWWSRLTGGRRRTQEDRASASGASERLYRLLAESAQDQIFVIGRDDRVQYVNRNAAEQFRTVPERLIGRPRIEIFPPQIAQQQKRSLDQVFETGKPIYVESSAVYAGRDVWLGTWLTPATDEAGAVTAVIGSSRDITERKRAEEALRESEQRLQAVVSNIPLVLWTTDADGAVQFCSGRGLVALGLTSQDLVGKPIEQAPFGESPELGVFVRRALAGESPSGQVTLQGLTWDAWCAPQRDAGGTIIGALGLLVDVTERQRLQEHLSKTEALETLGRMAGGMAHDFNNHLTVMLGYAEMMLAQIGDDKPISADLHEVQRAGQRAAGLVRRLLAFGRRQVVQPRQQKFNEVIQGLRPVLERVVGEHIRMKFELAPELYWINGDVGQLEQILMNLVLNARDAMPKGGTLRIETRNLTLAETDDRALAMPAGQYAALIVGDTGQGMDARTKDHLFEPFFTTKPEGEGTGLGLPTVYGIVKQFGGFIFVDSEVGRGTTFSLYWPAITRTLTESVPAPKAPPPAVVVGRETILLVEDEETVRRFARLALERHGFHVIEASSPKEALVEAATVRSIDLLVTDVVMPGDSGVDLAAEMKRVRPGVPVLYISGYPANLIAQDGHLADVSAHLLLKPFTSEDLLRSVDVALGRSAARK